MSSDQTSVIVLAAARPDRIALRRDHDVKGVLHA
jgi:hypothetical protein